jgi:sugar fermentation stimulation protein A
MNPLLKIEKFKECIIEKRLNRFVVEVKLDSDRNLASINNTGKLKEFLAYGKKGYCIEKEIPKKTKYRLFAVEDYKKCALIDTYLQMKAFEIAVENNLIPWLKGYKILKRNPKIENSVLDYLLTGPNGETYLEIKSAVLRKGELASYPDCLSTRGGRHIQMLINLARSKKRSMIVFISGIYGVKGFTPNVDVDPEISRLLKLTIMEKVTVKAISLYFDPQEKGMILENPNLKIYYCAEEMIWQYSA